MCLARGVEFAERAPYGRRHLARIRPARAKWQLRNRLPAAAHPLENPHRDLREKTVRRRMHGQIAPDGESVALLPRPQMPLHLALAQLAQQIRQRNADRAYAIAFTA